MAIKSIDKAQIKAHGKIHSKIQVKIVLFNEVLIIILVIYSNYNNIFLVKNAVKFLKYTKIIDYTIKLEKNKQLLFRSIYNLGLIELKTLKIYIKIHLVNNFIYSYKFFA